MITLENKKESKWYVLKVFSGQENKIKAHMDIELKRSGMDKVVTQVLIPTEKVYQIKAGKKVVKEKKILDAEIDKGAPNNQQYVFHGEADEFPGVEPGDVVIIVQE